MIRIRNLARTLARGVFILSLCATAGCMGIRVDTVNRGDPGAIPAGQSLVVGRIRHVVDGAPLRYGILEKPRLQLFRRDDASYHASPEADADGRFAWTLPPGDYGVAVLFGGMSPAGVPHMMANGVMVRVNGIVDPGLEFRAEAGRIVHLGTVEVRVRSRLTSALLGGRVFGALEDIVIVDDAGDTDLSGGPIGQAGAGAPALRKLDGARPRVR
jgi:hypothetical protein